jgi:hypothetical protein
VALGTANVFISAAKTLEAIGVEDALSSCPVAALIAITPTSVLSS